MKSIGTAVDNLNGKLDSLVTVAQKLYTEVNPFTFKAFQTLPTAVILFGGVTADKNMFKFLTVGGSAAGAVVLVPERVTKISAKGQVIEQRTNWLSNSSLVSQRISSSRRWARLIGRSGRLAIRSRS